MADNNGMTLSQLNEVIEGCTRAPKHGLLWLEDYLLQGIHRPSNANDVGNFLLCFYLSTKRRPVSQSTVCSYRARLYSRTLRRLVLFVLCTFYPAR